MHQSLHTPLLILVAPLLLIASPLRSACAQEAEAEVGSAGVLVAEPPERSEETTETEAQRARDVDEEFEMGESEPIIAPPNPIAIPEPPSQSRYSGMAVNAQLAPTLRISGDVNRWTESFWPGVLGSLIGMGGSVLIGVGLAAFSWERRFLDDNPAAQIGLSTLIPVSFFAGTAAGVAIHGARVGGHGRFGAAFGGALLGSVVAGAFSGITFSMTRDEEVVLAVLPLALLTLPALFSSWAYWKNSSRRSVSARPLSPPGALPRYTWVPDIRIDQHRTYLGVLSIF